jgi:hypothetical protein
VVYVGVPGVLVGVFTELELLVLGPERVSVTLLVKLRLFETQDVAE